MNIKQIIANELKVNLHQVSAAIELLDGGATVPFISRYRKEVTGGLSDTALRHLEERLHYLRELEERRQVILKSIAEQNKLTPELEQSILAVENKSLLEDIYLPYKPKRRTKAQIAREAGLGALAEQLLANPNHDPEVLASTFINAEKNVNTVEEALSGARYILMELFSEDANLITELRERAWEQAILKSEIIKDKEKEGSKFSDYFHYEEAIKKIPSHRALALLRGQREDILALHLILNEDEIKRFQQSICQHFKIKAAGRKADAWLVECVNAAWRIKFMTKFELDLMLRLREQAEEEAIVVFANNLKHLLMASPAGSRTTLGLDPGLRTGVKLVVLDGTGKLLHHDVIFPHEPRHDWQTSIAHLKKICVTYNVELVAIGNGTASRETDRLVLELKKHHPELKLTSIVISEAGASVYSASELAAQEFPHLDVSYRGAVSIGRRLQDPLAELVKIDPKSIGVGQYQHDVNQAKLSRALRAVMEDCVNAVGVDVNTASAPLLACIAGLNLSVAENIVSHREQHGAFKTRHALKKVPRLGERAFEQAAGFLRIVQGDNPLDASAVHPEAYSVVEKMLKKQEKSLAEVMGNARFLKTLKVSDYTDEQFGMPTVTDILQELEKPGRDPRPEFKTATFKEGIERLSDLKPGLILEGVITNVANFGAFVDIGVHQDGLVHISQLANHFVKDPHQVVKVGDIVKVKVLEVDLARKRIQLSMNLTETKTKQEPAPKNKKMTMGETTLANALLKAMKKS